MSKVLNGVNPLVRIEPVANRRWVIRLALPALLVVSSCAYLGLAYAQGRARTVWVVNGLERDYDVALNGMSVHLPALEAVPVKVGEGALHVTSADPSLPLTEQTCEVCTPLLSRPFTKLTFAINPDHSALLCEEDTLYSKDIRESKDSDHQRFLTGDLLYVFSGVDYPFREFPEIVKVSGSRAQMKRVALWSQGNELQRMRFISRELGREAAAGYARNLALCNPDDPQPVMMAISQMQPADALAFLRAGLEQRPVRVHWHRFYQEMMQRARPDDDLGKEYQERLTANPNDATLMYLMGRISADKTEATRWFRKSTQGDRPCAYGYFALAYDALAAGQFEEALSLSDKAIQLVPGDDQFREIRFEALSGLGRHGELLAMIREQESKDPMNPRIVLGEVRLLASAGRKDEARQAIANYLARVSRPGNQEQMRRFESHAQALIQYVDGDVSAYARLLESASGSPEARFQAAVCLGHLDDAAAALAMDQAASAGQHLLLYILATDANRVDLATEHLKIAIEGYQRGGRGSRLVAQWLSTTASPDPAAVSDLALMPDEKRLVLAALALRDPEHRQALVQQAAVLNYDRAFPYWTVKQILDRQVTRASSP